jgi:hypothetical protein
MSEENVEIVKRGTGAVPRTRMRTGFDAALVDVEGGLCPA